MFRFFSAVAIACVLPLAAQTTSVRKASLNLSCLRYAQDVRALMLKSDPASPPTKVPFYQGGFTAPVPILVENGRIVVYKKGDVGQAPWIPDWSFAVPDGRASLSVILLPGSPTHEPSAPYSAFTLPPITDFPYGSVLAVNLSPYNTRLDFKRKKLSLAPGASMSATLESEADAFNMMPVTAWIQTQGSWRTLHTTQWAYNQRYRQVSLIWMDAAAKRPEITSIREVQPM
jgi:hypothetical protein